MKHVEGRSVPAAIGAAGSSAEAANAGNNKRTSRVALRRTRGAPCGNGLPKMRLSRGRLHRALRLPCLVFRPVLGNRSRLRANFPEARASIWTANLKAVSSYSTAALPVGPDGRIRANLRARSIVIQGRVDGNLYGLERVELKKSATFAG